MLLRTFWHFSRVIIEVQAAFATVADLAATE
jgi:hypothetical protein